MTTHRRNRIRNYLVALVIGVTVGACIHIALAPAAPARWGRHSLTHRQAANVRLIREVWRPEGRGVVRKALRVVWCESRFDDHADNPVSSAWGLWQFLDGAGMSARRQTIRAREWYHARGWNPWVCA